MNGVNFAKRMGTTLILGLCCLLAFAQGKTVTGTVTDAAGEPLIGVSVKVKGAQQGAITDFDGNFKLDNIGQETTLVFSYVGFISQEVKVGTQSMLNITLREDTQSLEEVVVIGYGSVKKKDITGSVATVNSDALVAVPVASVTEALTGKLAGVQITTTEGSPDAEMKIRVRGGGSITQSNDPLYIVDGFPVESISDIPATDIEDITVLKDASSTAIYGSRGANGVIIVTTKSGKEGKISVNYNAYISYKKLADKLNVLGSGDYARWQYELAMLDNSTKPNEINPESYSKFFGNWQDIDLYNDVATNDWQDIVFGRTGHTFNHNLSLTGGSDKMKFSFSYAHMDDKAIMQMSDFKRDNLSLKLNAKPVKNVTLDFSVRYAKTKVNGGGMNEQSSTSSSDARLKHAMIYTPFPVAGLSDATIDSGETDPSFNLYNPLESIRDTDRRQSRETLNMAGSFTWEIFDDFKFKSEFGYDTYRNQDNRFYGLTTYYVKNTPAEENKEKPAVILKGTDRNTFRNTNTVSYDFEKLLGKDSDHHLNVMVGEEYIIKKEKVMTNTLHGFPVTFDADQCFKLTTQGKAYEISDFYNPDDILFSFFGRVNYDYQSKYLFSATFRADGSSKFAEGNRWGYFPSAALAWRVSAEPFMEGTQSWLDDLKLRLSYGTAGNNNIPTGVLVQTWNSQTTGWLNPTTIYWAPSKTMANPDLKWETTITRNIGLDYTLFGGRLNGTFEYYWNTTKDLLILFPTSGTGYDSQYRNMGKTQNTSFEASINWIAVDKQNFGLSFNANIGFNKNKIKSLGMMNDFGQDSGWGSSAIGDDYWVAVGGQVGEMIGFRNDGRYEVSDFSGYDELTHKWILKEGIVDCSSVIGDLRPGSMKLKDLTGEGVVDQEDREIIGNANPLHTGGFGMNMRLYGFDLSANFNWSVGNDVYNANKIEYTTTAGSKYRNMLDIMSEGKRWTNLNEDGTLCNDPQKLAEMNANTTMWSPYMKQYVFSDWAVEDGSFLRLNTLTLGYTLPKALLSKVKIQSLRFYVTGYNLFCWTNYSGFDPEVSTRRQTNLTPGVDYSAYPKSRSVVFGLNLNF